MSAKVIETSALPRQVGKKKERISPLRSVLAGSTAGAVEIAITYPAEFAKTRAQLNERLTQGQKLPWPKFGPVWYAGCTTLIIGNSIKAGVRFVVFDQIKELLQDANGNLSGPKTVVAGLGAGVFESVLAVTPFESIKTTLIDDRKAAKPRLRGFLHAVPLIARERGIAGFYQGLVPTTLKQSLNSATRFGSYGALTRIALSYKKEGEKLGSTATFAIGGAAGAVTVYVTQPVDTIKTRMQSIEAKSLYRNSLHCTKKLVMEEGVFKLWSGAVPRLVRLRPLSSTIYVSFDDPTENTIYSSPKMANANQLTGSGAAVAEQNLKREEAFVEDIDFDKKNASGSGYVMTTYRSYNPEYSNGLEKKLVRRIDIRIMPLVVIIYIFSYLDRNSITQARLYGLQEDTNVTGAVYNTAISIFSVGYVIMQLPSTVLMTKLRPSIYLPGCMIAWAIVSGSTAAASSPAGLLVARFMLGIIEAPFYPGAVYFLSCWYTKKELGIRMAFLISGLLLSNAFAGLISAGILSGMDGVGNMAAWRWLFILEGLATIAIAIVALVFLPDYPATTKWLSEEEAIVAQGRLAKDAGSEDVLDEEKVSMLKGIKWALQDPRTWMFACLQMCASAAISYSHFFPTLISQLGFTNNTTTLLLTSPPYILAFLWSLGLALSADKMQTRSPHAAISMLVGIIGAILLIAVPIQYKYPRYAFTFLVASGSFGVYSSTYTWLSSTIIRPPVKRAAAIGIANTISNTAALFGGYFWLDIYSPAFRESWGCELAFMFLGLGCILTLRLVLQRANKAFDKLAAEIDPNDSVAMAALDDDSQRAVQNGFRYII
ncbi:hypothetical protein V492_04697 [Pseudogymnoascus sp. VKM F-4246]|nr:hypothetical protein V492_04697 [Pseudogymnoascus sp. VKM F-4246]